MINDPIFTYRIVFDTCVPTIERREETKQDIMNDINVIEGKGSIADFFNSLSGYMYQSINFYFYDSITGDYYDLTQKDKDYERIVTSYSTEYIVTNVLSGWEDPGDGTPNIFYLSINGKELNSIANVYYDMDNNLLKTGTRNEIIADMLENVDYIDDEDEDSYDDEYVDDEYVDDEDN